MSLLGPIASIAWIGSDSVFLYPPQSEEMLAYPVSSCSAFALIGALSYLSPGQLRKLSLAALQISNSKRKMWPVQS